MKSPYRIKVRIKKTVEVVPEWVSREFWCLPDFLHDGPVLLGMWVHIKFPRAKSFDMSIMEIGQPCNTDTWITYPLPMRASKGITARCKEFLGMY